jgi:protection-of-telomeres protein 1
MKEHGIDKESTLDQIINNPRRETVTPKGRKFTLPFVNTRHVARLWVADYYPHDLKDFVRQVPTVDGKTKWQWYFQLIVCDADVDRTKVKTKGLSAEQVISLKVQDKEAITLLGGLQPHDLNTRRGESTIKKLQEKLFILWGDLAEMKDKYLASHPEITPDRQFSYISHLLLINNRPFTAGIREYGVEDGKGGLELHRWNKYWEIFDTRIV